MSNLKKHTFNIAQDVFKDGSKFISSQIEIHLIEDGVITHVRTVWVDISKSNSWEDMWSLIGYHIKLHIRDNAKAFESIGS